MFYFNINAVSNWQQNFSDLQLEGRQVSRDVVHPTHLLLLSCIHTVLYFATYKKNLSISGSTREIMKDIFNEHCVLSLL